MSRHHNAMSGWRWAKVREQVLARAGGHCEIRNPAVCRGIATQVDHVIELSKGGDPYALENCRAACQPCNLARNRRHPTVDTTWTVDGF